MTSDELVSSLQAQVEKLTEEREACLRQAEQWAMEARGHKSSLHEAYQAVTGATGEPGNWNGARPIIEAFNALRSKVSAQREGLEPFARAAEHANVEGISIAICRDDGTIIADDSDFRQAVSLLSVGGLDSSSPAVAAAPDGATSDQHVAGKTVATAAIWIGGTVFTLPRPNRHHNIMWWLSTLGIRSGQMHEQGFVLSNGHYAGREEAAKIALAAGQIEKLISPPNLYSEDLWGGGADLPSIVQIAQLASPNEVSAGNSGLDAITPSPTLQDIDGGGIT